MRTIVLMLDSVNRRFLKCYGSREPAMTPNIDRLAEKGVVFDNHWVGSSPCMPARRDMFTGRLSFLECPWGGIQPCDDTLPRILKKNKIFSHMETDHFHYAEMGGENYMNQFTSWNLHRGTENDPINLRPCKTGIPDIGHAEHIKEDWLGIYSRCYQATKDKYQGKKENYSTARTFDQAADWLKESQNADRFMLWAEGFDPHEPFDVPDEFLDKYREYCDFDENFFWPPYDVTSGYTGKQITQITYRYKALLSMSDYYIGKILQVMDEHDMWKDTVVIFTTDHGYMLGEHGYFAKNYMPDYNELMHIPMIVCHPDYKPGRVGAITQNIDLLPTVMDIFGISMKEAANEIHGNSVIPLMDGSRAKNRDFALYGQFGKNVNITDGQYVYMCAPAAEDNRPLNIYTTVPYILGESIGLDTMEKENFKNIECVRLPWTDYPMLKLPAKDVKCDTSQGFNHRFFHCGQSQLFDIQKDYAQDHPIGDETLKKKYSQILKTEMKKIDTPLEQFERLGI